MAVIGTIQATLSQYGRTISWILCLCLYAFLCYTTLTFTVNVPFWDQWQFVPFIESWKEGTFTISQLFEQKNEHRSGVPRIIWLLMSDYSQWNHRWEVALNLAAALGSFWLCLVLARRQCQKAGVEFTPWLPPVIAIILFSLIQVENWMWGYQLQLFLCCFWLLLGIYVLDRFDSNGAFVLALAIGVLSSFSFANGLLYWFLLFPFVLLQTNGRVRGLVWVVAGFAVLFVYFSGYESPKRLGSPFDVIHHPLEFVRFFCALLGAPISRTSSTGNAPVAIVGLTGIVLWAGVTYFLLRRLGWKSLLPMLVLAAFALASAGLVSAGRLPKTLDFLAAGAHEPYRIALASKYTTFSQYFWVALLLEIYLLGGIVNKKPITRIMHLSIGGAACALLAVSISHYDTFAHRSDRMEKGRDAILAGQLQHPDIKGVVWSGKLLERRVPVLKRYGYSLFSSQE